MTKRSPSIVFLGSLALIGACAAGPSSGSNEVTAKGCMDPTGPGCQISVDDGSWVRWTGPVTDGVDGGTSSAVVEQSARQICMSGSVDAGPTGSGWGAILLVGLTTIDKATGTVRTPLDAPALGIKQVRFTVENPPVQGVLPQVNQLQAADCNNVSDCSTVFGLATPVTSPGTVTASLTDFTQPDGTHANTSLDQTLITGMQFYVPSLPGAPVAYDFCLRDFALLDGSGREIAP